MENRRASALVCFFILALILTRPMTAVSQTIKVGTSVSLSGAYAAGGKDVKAGYDLAVKHINEDGGIFVKEYNKKLPMELIMLDDESDTVKTVLRMEKLYSSDNVVAYLGSFGSGMNVAQLSTAEKNKVPWIGCTIALEAPFRQGYKYTFKAFQSSRVQCTVLNDLVKSIPEQKRPTKFAIWELQDDWGKEVAAYDRQLIAQSGWKVVADEKYSPRTADFSPLILNAKQAGAEVIQTTYTPPQALTVPKQMKELGWRPLLHCSIRGPDLTNYWDSLGQDASYIISLASWDSSFTDAVSRRLVKDYFVQNPNAKYCGSVVGNAYNCVVVLADAIKRAGTLDRNKIRDAVATTDLISLCGRMTFASDGQANMGENVRQWQNGKNLVVFPKERANGALMIASPWGQ